MLGLLGASVELVRSCEYVLVVSMPGVGAGLATRGASWPDAEVAFGDRDATKCAGARVASPSGSSRPSPTCPPPSQPRPRR